MSTGIQAEFRRTYRDGPTIHAAIEQPLSGFSITVLFGPSGCGKSTVLRCLAGLDRPDEGTIRFEGENWFDSHSRVCASPQQRRIGFLFQDYALFPHLTVRQNIAYALRRLDRGERDRRVDEMISRFQLEGLDGRYPTQVSGGQQQRVALARVLVHRPRLLLLDEPLSALDDNLRRDLRRELRRILGEFETPVVLVTHDRLEAMALADQIVVMESGQVLQAGPVQEIFSRPAVPAVARIVGTETVITGEVIETRDGLATVDVGTARLLAVAAEDSSTKVHVCIKGEDVMIQRGISGDQSVRNRIPARVTSVTPEGPLMRVGLDCGFELSALVSRQACVDLHLTTDQQVTACVKTSSIHLIPGTSAKVSDPIR